MIKNVNGIDYEMTPEEEAEFIATLPPVEPPVQGRDGIATEDNEPS